MLDPLIATIHPEDGSARDVCKALVPKFKEPNVIVIKGGTDTTAFVRVNFGGVCHQKFESTPARAISLALVFVIRTTVIVLCVWTNGILLTHKEGLANQSCLKRSVQPT